MLFGSLNVAEEDDQYYVLKFEEVQLAQCSDDTQAQCARTRRLLRATQARAQHVLREVQSTPDFRMRRSFEESRRRTEELWAGGLPPVFRATAHDGDPGVGCPADSPISSSAVVGGGGGDDDDDDNHDELFLLGLSPRPHSQPGRRHRRRSRGRSTAAKPRLSKATYARMSSSGGAYAAYFQLQQQYRSSHSDFVEASSVVRGSTQVLLDIDDQYTDEALSAVDVRAHHRQTMARLDAALATSKPGRVMDDLDAAIDELLAVRGLLDKTVAAYPTVVSARVGVAQCDKRLEYLRSARLHVQKQAIMGAIHGANYMNANLCETDFDESMVRAVFEALDADHSGDLNRDEVAQLIYFFEERVPSDTALDEVMAHMGRAGTGTVSLDDFLYWWRERIAGASVVDACAAIQSHFRGRAARRDMAQDRMRIVNLQARVRSKLARGRFLRSRRMRLEREAAEFAAEMHRRNEAEAATKIQSGFRGKKSRRVAAAQREERYLREMESASLRIQASFRGMKGRRQGETQRDYQKRMYHLNLRAVRMWANRTLWGAFSDWSDFINAVRQMRQRSLRRWAHGSLLLTFERWVDYVHVQLQIRHEAVTTTLDRVVKLVADSDPQEFLRRKLLSQGVDGDALHDRLQHYRACVNLREQEQEFACDVPSPPACMLQGRERKQGGIWSKIRGKAEQQHTPGMLVRLLATRRPAKNAWMVTIEPQQSLHLSTPSGLRLGCRISTESSISQGLDEMDQHFAAPDLDFDVMNQHAHVVSEQSMEEEDEMLAWEPAGDLSAAVFAVDDVLSQRVGGMVYIDGESINELADGSSPLVKLGTFSVGLKHLADDVGGAKWELACTIIECDGLSKADYFGANDVYVSLIVDASTGIQGEPQRTTTVNGGGAAPVWRGGQGETLTWSLQRAPQSVAVHVFDEDVGSDDDLLGASMVPIISGGNESSHTNDSWYNLSDSAGDGNARVRLRWTCRPVVVDDMAVKYVWATCKPPPPSLQLRVCLDDAPSDGVHPGISVEVVRADALPHAAGSWDSPDPYCLLEICPARWRGQAVTPAPQKRKTKALSDTPNPRWDEALRFDGDDLAVGFAPPPDMPVFTQGADEEAVQTTLRQLRTEVRGGSHAASAPIWWPALGQDPSSEELRWVPTAIADSELGLFLSEGHAFAGASLKATVIDKDFLSADDVISVFPELPLAAIQPGVAQTFWLEAQSRVRPPSHEVDGMLSGEKARARALFDDIDANGNGLLDRGELAALSSQLGGLAVDAEAMMVSLDSDGSGEVDFDTFWAWWQQMSSSKKQKGRFMGRLFS
jgi:Ca2+-binding EF-hand superfamily protein